MKKSVLVLIMIAVTLAVFAVDIDRSDAPITLDGSATLEWGYNVDTKANGFMNSASLSLLIPLVDKDIFYTKSDDPVYGYIELNNVEWLLGQNTGGTLAPGISGSVTAKFMIGPFFIGVVGAPAFLINKNLSVTEDETGDVGFSGFSDYTYGTTLGYKDEMSPVEASIKVLSKGSSWRDNTKSEYEFGSDITYFAIPGIMDINASIASKRGDDQIVYGGIDVPVSFEVAQSLVLTPAADFKYTNAPGVTEKFTYDAGLTSVLNLSFQNEDKVSSNLKAKLFYGTDKDISANMTFMEPPAGGLIDSFGFSSFISVVDILEGDPNKWFTGAGTSYKFSFDDSNSLEPNIQFKTNYQREDLDDIDELKTLVTFKCIQFANTEISATYSSGNFLAKKVLIGEIVGKLTISY